MGPLKGPGPTQLPSSPPPALPRRTLDPEEADFFYVPTYTSCTFDVTGGLLRSPAAPCTQLLHPPLAAPWRCPLPHPHPLSPRPCRHPVEPHPAVPAGRLWPAAHAGLQHAGGGPEVDLHQLPLLEQVRQASCPRSGCSTTAPPSPPAHPSWRTAAPVLALARSRLHPRHRPQDGRARSHLAHVARRGRLLRAHRHLELYDPKPLGPHGPQPQQQQRLRAGQLRLGPDPLRAAAQGLDLPQQQGPRLLRPREGEPACPLPASHRYPGAALGSAAAGFAQLGSPA